ncbi:hypothetical protein E2C01_080043 [Portunus trituberculatus]|uniref:Uncharacterized protein n=1 Tax=Portunus trituberculatus TaxID=210409 RepID=A0A5B7IUY1_PORTR|nr:hypothetical protein [Portunus trituberculatus]
MIVVPSLVPGFSTANAKEVREVFGVSVQDVQQTSDCYCRCSQRNTRRRRRRRKKRRNKRVILGYVPMKC